MLFGIFEFRIFIYRVREGYKEFEKVYNVKFFMRMKVCFGNFKESGDEFVECRIEFEEILKNYDVVLIVIGIWNVYVLMILGLDFEGVYLVFEYLFRIKSVKLGYMDWSEVFFVEGRKVFVVGVGYSVVDVVFESINLGVEKVYMSYCRMIREVFVGVYEINFF